MVDPDRRSGVGIVGLGHAARTFHIPLIAAEPRLVLRAVATSRPASAAVGRRVVVVPSVEAMVERDDVDLVVVATPHQAHAAAAEVALRAGKHVVVEKPLAVTIDEADALVALAAERDLVLATFHNRRWDGGFLTVEALVNDSRLGDVRHYEAWWDRWEPDAGNGWREAGGAGSGTLWDLGAHLVAETLVLFGPAELIDADVRVERPGARAVDVFRLHLRCGPVDVVLGSSMLREQCRPRHDLRGTAGQYVKHGHDPQAAALERKKMPGAPGWGEETPTAYGTLTSSDGSTTEAVPTRPGRWPAFYAEVAASVLDGAPLSVPASLGRNVVALLTEASLSLDAQP